MLGIIHQASIELDCGILPHRQQPQAMSPVVQNSEGYDAVSLILVFLQQEYRGLSRCLQGLRGNAVSSCSIQVWGPFGPCSAPTVTPRPPCLIINLKTCFLFPNCAENSVSAAEIRARRLPGSSRFAGLRSRSSLTAPEPVLGHTTSRSSAAVLKRGDICLPRSGNSPAFCKQV